MHCRVVALIVGMGLAAAALADEGKQGFRDQVAPILERHCVACHNADEHKGGLSLQNAADALRGGESGPVIEPGKPEKSLLLSQIVGDKPEMPKRASPLTKAEIATIRQWIASGADWPRELVLRARPAADTNWWSLKPLTRPAVPKLTEAEARWVRNPVDAFVRAQQIGKQLFPAPEADRRTLIRRLYYDLLGLPPSPDDIDAFVGDKNPAAYENLVDKLLAMPQYGERWARHWLDVVHFGETHGYDKDQPRPNAWPYRDYVIRAFNEDKPYSRFVEEQIAGDVLFPNTRDGSEALGFIAAGPWDFIGHAEVAEAKIDGKIARHLDRDDMVGNTIGTFVSLTAQCAQCHNHKFDPISQEDYYRLQAVFAALDRADRRYYADGAAQQKFLALAARRDALKREQKQLDETLARLGGAALAELDKRIAGAQPRKGSPAPEYGYHSAISPQQAATKWVQIDLGESRTIERIVAIPCHDDFNNIGAGFGFPVRYKIELSDDGQFAEGVTALADHTGEDVANPGTTPQVVPVGGKSGRYVRVAATKLAPRMNDYIFALAELQVFTADDKNAAAGGTVTALDSIEAPVRWRKANLVDGLFPGAGPVDSAATLASMQAERVALLARVLGADGIQTREKVREQIAENAATITKLPAAGTVYAGTVYAGSGTFVGTGATGGKPREIFLLRRGDVKNPDRELGPLSPGALSCIETLRGRFDLPVGHVEGERRAALAKWIADAKNPLSWRSIVNRVWLYHFGRGLVDTPNDFGRMGQLPTHPELLDWLAVEFRDGRQSLKALHRLLVTSATYRQSSSGNEAQAKIDTSNAYLWRMNRRRLEAEALRDAVLSVSGKLDSKMGGPSFQDFVIQHPEHSPHYEYQLHDPSDTKTFRRSIYRFLVRSQPQPFMTSLDCADPSMRVDKRNESISAVQALALLNNGFMVTMSRHFAARVERSGTTPDEQTRQAFRLALGREPTSTEAVAVAQLIKTHGLPTACRLLFNLNEFSFVD